MDGITNSFRRFLSPDHKDTTRSPDTVEFDGVIVKMSELNQSYSDSIKSLLANDSSSLNQIPNNISAINNTFNVYKPPTRTPLIPFNPYTSTLVKSPRSESSCKDLTSELDDLDFQKFVEDLSGPTKMHQEIIISKNAECGSYSINESQSILVGRKGNKDILIFDSRPNVETGTNVVKLKIVMPKNNNVHANMVQIVNDITPREEVIVKKKPIMGKNALLARVNSPRINPNREDSEIVQELVTARFSRFLTTYYEKSFQRQTLKRSKKCCDEEEATKKSQNSLVESCGGSAPSYKYESITSYSSETVSHSPISSPSTSDRYKTFDVYSTVGKTEMNLDFLLSTDEHNVETSAQSMQEESNEEFDDRISYDAHEFLRDALGDELGMYMSTDSQNMSDMEPSENHSIGTSNISALLSKNGSSMQHYTVRNYSERYEDYTYNEYDEYSDRKSDLILQCDVQNQIVTQVSKALSVCKSTKEFIASGEEIEAERILLVATTKRDALKEEIQRVEYEDIHEEPSGTCGCVLVTGITFPPKQRSSLLSSVFDKRRREYTHWYICVLRSGPTVFATKSIKPDDDGLVRFDEEFRFDNLDSDFEITVSVYSMKVKNNMRNYSHESKFHLNKNVNTMCPSPTKLLKMNRESKHRKSFIKSQSSSFVLGGRCVLRINSLTELGYFKLSDMPLCSQLEGTAVINFTTAVNISEEHSGFLNVGSESNECVLWNRRWCTIQGARLVYYNYPGEEEHVGYLDLSCCITSYITTADREICPRPKTLLVETVPRTTDKGMAQKPVVVTRHFLSAETLQGMKIWQAKLNNTVAALRNWNSMNCNFQFERDES